MTKSRRQHVSDGFLISGNDKYYVQKSVTIFPPVSAQPSIQIYYTKFANFAGSYFPYFQKDFDTVQTNFKMLFRHALVDFFFVFVSIWENVKTELKQYAKLRELLLID
jgi:hypothetical protein